MIPQPVITLPGGIAMPQLGLGLWQTPAEDAAHIITDAIEAGYRAVDSAAAYQNEEGVGAALADHPDIFVTTKLWNAAQGYDSTLAAFDESMRKLRRDVLDLYLIHWPLPMADRYVDTWKALVRLKQDGRIRAIGVSNFNPDHIERLESETGGLPAINQIELHPRFQQAELRAYHAQKGIVTQGWSPLGRDGVLDSPVIGAIAARIGRTPAQVVIRWHLDNGFVTIPKSVRPERLRENIAVFDFALSADDHAAIATIDAADGRTGPDPKTFDMGA